MLDKEPKKGIPENFGNAYIFAQAYLIDYSVINKLASFIDNVNYSIIVATLPEPTVLPPSRIANPRPCSIAIG